MTIYSPSGPIFLVACVIALGGCQDLNVPNTNSPSVTGTLSTPEGLESNLASTFPVWWGVAHGARTSNGTQVYPVVQLSALGEDITSADISINEVTQLPRIPYNNIDAGQWFNRKPWYDLYQAIATTTDVLKALDKGLKIGDVTSARPQGTHTDRARWFAKWIQGMSLTYVGLLFDKGFILDETVDVDPFKYPFKSNKEVFDAGIADMTKAIALAKAAPADTTPISWINGFQYTNAEMARIMTSYVARSIVYFPRDSAARKAIDWNGILNLIGESATSPQNQGIQKDFVEQAVSSNGNTISSYVQYTQLQTNGRTSNNLLGPADTSGGYQTWLATPITTRTDFQIISPDRRIHAASGSTAQGKYFVYIPTQTMTAVRGTYMWSRYKNIRYGTNYYNTGIINGLTLLEMDFLRAEALFRLGRKSDAAAIINKTRVANGQLPPVTVDGPPPGRACVPKRADGSCGDLLDALQYEKRIELHGYGEALVAYADWRGWGKLPKGSLINIPVSGRDLQTLGLPVYTFGGDLPGSAP